MSEIVSSTWMFAPPLAFLLGGPSGSSAPSSARLDGLNFFLFSSSSFSPDCGVRSPQLCSTFKVLNKCVEMMSLIHVGHGTKFNMLNNTY